MANITPLCHASNTPPIFARTPLCPVCQHLTLSFLPTPNSTTPHEQVAAGGNSSAALVRRAGPLEELDVMTWGWAADGRLGHGWRRREYAGYAGVAMSGGGRARTRRCCREGWGR
jgi:hypothetical protein